MNIFIGEKERTANSPEVFDPWERLVLRKEDLEEKAYTKWAKIGLGLQ